VLRVAQHDLQGAQTQAEPVDQDQLHREDQRQAGEGERGPRPAAGQANGAEGRRQREEGGGAEEQRDALDQHGLQRQDLVREGRTRPACSTIEPVARDRPSEIEAHTSTPTAT
jgi:hypothetical protein